MLLPKFVKGYHFYSIAVRTLVASSPAARKAGYTSAKPMVW
jgi:hypothetical protein